MTYRIGPQNILWLVDGLKSASIFPKVQTLIQVSDRNGPWSNQIALNLVPFRMDKCYRLFTAGHKKYPNISDNYLWIPIYITIFAAKIYFYPQVTYARPTNTIIGSYSLVVQILSHGVWPNVVCVQGKNQLLIAEHSRMALLRGFNFAHEDLVENRLPVHGGRCEGPWRNRTTTINSNNDLWRGHAGKFFWYFPRHTF